MHLSTGQPDQGAGVTLGILAKGSGFEHVHRPHQKAMPDNDAGSACGCCAPPAAFLSSVHELAVVMTGLSQERWQDSRPFTQAHHWTCRGDYFQSLLIDKLLGRRSLDPLEEAACAAMIAQSAAQSPPSDSTAPFHGRRPSMDAPGDIVLVDGKIFTADPDCPWVEALAIRAGRVVARGSTNTVRSCLNDAGWKPRVVELAGRTVIPGFNDAHMHHTPDPSGIRLPIDPVANPDADTTLALIREAVAHAADGTWIFGVMGEATINDTGFDRTRIDAVAPNHPVILLGLTNHTNVVNSCAMARLGIDEHEPDPLGGHYSRLPGTGGISGRIHEYAQWSPQRCFASMATIEEGAASLRLLAAQCAAFGITTLQNMSWTPAGRYVDMLKAADLPIRVRVIRFPPSGPEGRYLGEGADLPCHPGPRIEVSGTKWILDGTTVERAAAMDRPYADRPETSGAMNFAAAEIEEMLRESDRSGDQLLLHAIGTRTVDAVVGAIETVNGGRGWDEKGLRIEHADGLTTEHIERVRSLGVQIVQNPGHFLFPEIYGPRFGSDALYASFRRLVEANIPLGIGSDGPLSPFLQLFAATTHPANPSEALTIEDAVTAYTWGSAKAENKGDHKGKLAPGYLADCSILSQDIFSIDPHELPATVSVMTIVDGHVIYERESAAG